MRSCTRCRCIYRGRVEHCGIDGTRLVVVETDTLIGEQIDRYRVLEFLSDGAVASVYRVGHATLEREYAMKVLFGDYATDRRVVERFRREAKAASKIRHPNVMSVVDFGSTPEGLTFSVMELVRGRTLTEVIASDAPMSPFRAAELTRQIASGLDEAHRLGFVHRDIKPDNIMVTDDAGFEYIKIVDFGIVAAEADTTRTPLTASGHVIGTPAYMAPERVHSTTADPSSDLYALGIILYEMLTGRRPFTAPAPIDVMLEHAGKSPPPLPPSHGLETLAEWLVEKRVDDRPASARVVLDELERLSLGARVAARMSDTARAPDTNDLSDHLHRSYDAFRDDLASALESSAGRSPNVDADPTNPDRVTTHSRSLVESSEPPVRDTLLETPPSMS